MSFFPGHVESTKSPPKNSEKNNPGGIIFVTISCQRVEGKIKSNLRGFSIFFASRRKMLETEEFGPSG